RNPIAAFGSRVGGSPMFCGQPYTFGVYAGDATDTASDAIRIRVLNRASWSLVATQTISVPVPSQATQWSAFQTNGYTKTHTANGLTTVLAFNGPAFNW